MDTFCPFLGSFGRSVMTFRRMLRSMYMTARTVYRDRQAFIANEAAIGGSTQFNKTDVLSNLGQSNQIEAAGSGSLMLNSKNGVQGFQHGARRGGGSLTHKHSGICVSQCFSISVDTSNPRFRGILDPVGMIVAF